MDIPLQGNVGVDMTKKFAQSLDVASSLQAGGGKRMPEKVRMDFPDRCLTQINLNALPVAAGLHRLFCMAGEKPDL